MSHTPFLQHATAIENFDAGQFVPTRETTPPVTAGANYSELALDVFRVPAERADNYGHAIEMGIAIKNEVGDAGLPLWQGFCGQSSKYTPEWCESKWSTFGAADGKKLTRGSIRHWGQQHTASQHVEASLYRRFTWKELLEGDFKRRELIKDCLVANEPCLIGGAGKTCKTSTALDAAISLATGTPFLGVYPCEHRRVLVMSGESGVCTIQETVCRIMKAKGITDPVDNFILSPDLPRFGNEKYIAALREFLERDSIEVLFVDPVYLAMPGGDAGNLLIQGDLLRSVSEVCDRLGVTLILCHHTKKQSSTRNKYQPAELADLSWAGFSEFARQWWLLARRERFVPGSGQHKLWLSIGGSAGHGDELALDIDEGTYPDRIWDVSIQRPHEARQEKATTAIDQHVAKCCDVLSSSPGMCQTPLMETAKVPRGQQKTVLAALAARGLIEETKVAVGTMGRMQDGFRLRAA